MRRDAKSDLVRDDSTMPRGALDNSRPSVAYRLALFAVIGTALPIKSLQLLLPVAYVGLLAFSSRSRACHRLLKWGSVLIVLSSLSMAIDAARGRNVSLPGLLFALLGYLPVMTVFCSGFDLEISAAERTRLVRALSVFVLLEALLGIAQFASVVHTDAIAGDTVTGTFGLFSDVTIGQVFYTFVLFNVIFFLYSHSSTRLAPLAIALGLLASILAQSGHQTIFVLIAILTVWLVSRGTVGRDAGLLLVLTGSAAGMMDYFYPETVELARLWLDKVLFDPDSLKWQLLGSISQVLDDPKNFLLGTGLGQFCSRGALISSGNYLVSVNLPAFLTAQSSYFVEDLQPLLDLFDQIGEGSAIPKPYFSTASWLVETGVPIFAWTLFLLAREAAVLLRCLRHSDRAVVRLTRALSLSFILFVLCTAIENYAEFAWCTFLPSVLYVLGRSELRRVLGERPYATHPSQSRSPAIAQLASRSAVER